MVDFTIDGNANFDDLVQEFVMLSQDQYDHAGDVLTTLCEAYMEASKWERITEIEH